MRTRKPGSVNALAEPGAKSWEVFPAGQPNNQPADGLFRQGCDKKEGNRLPAWASTEAFMICDDHDARTVPREGASAITGGSTLLVG